MNPFIYYLVVLIWALQLVTAVVVPILVLRKQGRNHRDRWMGFVAAFIPVLLFALFVHMSQVQK
jgi:F0F1-type ATP synthase assembly protein I